MKRLYILILTLLVILLGACNLEITNSNINSENNTGSTLLKSTWMETGIMDTLWDFNKIYKKTLMQTGKKQIEEAKQTMPITLEKWEMIENKYIGKKVSEFSKTKDLDVKLKKIGDYIRRANVLVNEQKYTKAHEELELVRKELRQIRAENNIVIISDDMLVFHDIMEEIVENEEKSLEELNLLKENLELLKNYNQDNSQYNQMLSELENVVNKLISTEGEDYKNTLKLIKPLYIKLYVNFG